MKYKCHLCFKDDPCIMLFEHSEIYPAECPFDNNKTPKWEIEGTGDMIESYDEIAKTMRDIFISKNADYGDSFSKSIEKYGIIAGVVRISDKMNRLETLCKNDAKVKDESLKDTLMDMANYCIMTAGRI